MYRGKFAWHVKCLKHPRYSPDRGGQQAIVGACPGCLKLYELQQALLRVRQLAKEAECHEK
jgi:hypothetical protein